MANICWFEMRIRGTKDNCYAMANSGIRCYDVYVKAENGTAEDYMMYLSGECAWGVYNSMVDIDESESLKAKALKFNVELEVCGLDEGNERCERYHYKGSKVLRENYLSSYLPADSVDCGECEISEEELAKYTKDEEHRVYILKNEFSENFSYDYDQGGPIFNFNMSFRDLPGFEDYEEISTDKDIHDFSMLDVLNDMGMQPDEQGFVLSEANDSGEVTLYGYYGTDKKVVIPQNVTSLEEGCFYGKEDVEEIVIPDSVDWIGEHCFDNCPNLKKLVIPSTVEGFCYEGEEEPFPILEGSNQVVIFTPAGSAAEKYAKQNNIEVIVDGSI